MFKRLINFSFLLILVISISTAGILFAKDQEEIPKEVYQKMLDYKKQIRDKIDKTQVRIIREEVVREGALFKKHGSGVKVLEAEQEELRIDYYIFSSHQVDYNTKTMEEGPEKSGITTYLIGRDKVTRKRIQLIAFAWRLELVVGKVEILEEDKEKFDFEVVEFAPILPQVNEEVFVGGYPEWGESSKNDGIVLERIADETPFRLHLDDRSWVDVRIPWRITVDVQGNTGGGISGGGLFNSRGEWAGLIWGGRGEHIIQATPVDVIYEKFLKKIPEIKDLLPKIKYDSGWYDDNNNLKNMDIKMKIYPKEESEAGCENK